MIHDIDQSNPGWRSEECECKHFRVVHGVRSVSPGHGACTVGGCPCPQFTWVEAPADPKLERRLEAFRRRTA